MPKQSFNDFLTLQAGPSTPRGRGRGGGMRGGRGGFGPVRGGGTPVAKRNYNADYTNVGFDYDAINKQGYRRMEGFSVDPFGSPAGATPDGGNGRGRGRGRGRGNLTPRTQKPFVGPHGTPRAESEIPHTPHTPHTASGSAPETPSGARTPVTGLGIPRPAAGSLLRGAIGSAARGKQPIRGPQPGSTRQTRDGQVIWGGRGAPLFVKAGELFKDGEVDTVHHEALEQPVAEQPATRMASVEFAEQMGSEEAPIVIAPAPVSPDAIRQGGNSTQAQVAELVAEAGSMVLDEASPSNNTSIQESETGADLVTGEEVPATTLIATSTEERTVVAVPVTVADSTVESAFEADTDMLDDQGDGAAESSFGAALPLQPAAPVSTASEVQIASADPVDDASEEQVMAEEDLFFIDTDPSGPAAEAPTIDYTPSTNAPIGTVQSSESEDEQIVFKPRTFGQPKPLEIRLPPAPAAARATFSRAAPAADMPPDLSLGTVMPKRTRAQKKAAKKEKRKMRGTGKKEAQKATKRSGFDAMDGSDIEWGSDGLPAGVFGPVDVDDMAEDDDGDVELLKDYLKGTMLGAASDSDSDDDEAGEEAGGTSGDVESEAAIAAPGLGSKASKASLKKGRKKMRQKGWDDAPEEILDSVLDIDGDDSSELGDLQAIMDALDSNNSDSDDDVGPEVGMMEEERIFTGKQAWTSEDEDEWFVRSMQEALTGGGKKGRDTHTALFGSIQDGYDDFELPTVPSKKGKKKIEGVPEELQAQWEADRRAKAAKKEQRQMERLLQQLAVAGPSSSSSGKRKTKTKAKNTVKAQQASLAHLIPASAAEVADMFDVSSDDAAMSALASGLDIGRGGGRKGKGKAMAQYAELAMSGFDVGGSSGMVTNSISTAAAAGIAGIVEQVRVFVDDPHLTTHTLPPMDKEGRRRMHMLAECFDMKSKSRGQGKMRFTVLIKTSRTGLNIDENAISRLLSASEYTGGHFYKAYYTNGKPNKFAPGFNGGKAGKKAGGPAGDRGSSARARDGELVGGGADRIGQDNVGHKLLSMMGWAEGGRIGRTQGGLEQPIVAVVKNTKSGLGA